MNKYLITIIFMLQFVMPAGAEDIYHNPPSENGMWPFTLELPNCNDENVINKIQRDFKKREREYWNSDLVINEFEGIQETGLRSHGLSYTPRRYCKTSAIFSDGVRRDVYFNITPDQSVLLTGQVIDWCVVGLDRTHADGPNCRRVSY